MYRVVFLWRTLSCYLFLREKISQVKNSKEKAEGQRRRVTLRIIEELKTEIKEVLMNGLESAKAAGLIQYTKVPEYIIEIPREKTHGDFAANVAMLMAKEAKMPPRKIGELLVAQMEILGSNIERVEIAGPGFINFFLKKDWLYRVPKIIFQMGDQYGSVPLGGGEKVQVEFVSANPTGLLHMGNARGAAIGDSLANLLQFAGYEVTREFYVNDAGNQIHLFGRSLDARYREALGETIEFPEDGYHGEDIALSAKRYLEQYGDALLKEEEEVRCKTLADFALKEKLSHIESTLKSFGVEYDVWFSERSLYENGKIKDTIDCLIKEGQAYEKEGAVWLKAPEGSEEKDEVLIRSNGLPTYFAADIAYHRDKFQRGFDRVINIWGADHHGHVARMKRAVSLFGTDPDRLIVILMQLVRLMRGEEIVRMSKRAGTYLTLEELLEEVGYDAARYFFVMRNPDSQMDFDLELAKSKTSENPVFYVQYAHARICSILRQAKSLGYSLPDPLSLDYSVLEDDSELALLAKLADLPEEVANSALTLEPHRLTVYLHDLAAAFHLFYTNCRVNTPEEELRNPRLALAKATALTIKNVLTLLGVSAPEEM